MILLLLFTFAFIFAAMNGIIGMDWMVVMVDEWIPLGSWGMNGRTGNWHTIGWSWLMMEWEWEWERDDDLVDGTRRNPLDDE